MIKKESIAIVPGSFDPITNGHFYVIKEARKLYDKIYVAVMINSEKNYTFSLEERKRISDSAVTDMDGVEVISYDGWLYELANSLKADAIVKGYRNGVDLEYEQKMAEFNKIHAPNTETVLIKSDEDLVDVSSTLVRKMIAEGKNLERLLPKNAISEIEKILKSR